jgi:hypothetical protein
MKTKTLLKANFTTFNDSSNWVSGKCGQYNFEAKLFDIGSPFGINKGKVSKFSMTDASIPCTVSFETAEDIVLNLFNKNIVVDYDRGWNKKPTKEVKSYFDAIMNLLEKSPKRFESEEN